MIGADGEISGWALEAYGLFPEMKREGYGSRAVTSDCPVQDIFKHRSFCPIIYVQLHGMRCIYIHCDCGLMHTDSFLYKLD